MSHADCPEGKAEELAPYYSLSDAYARVTAYAVGLSRTYRLPALTLDAVPYTPAPSHCACPPPYRSDALSFLLAFSAGLSVLGDRMPGLGLSSGRRYLLEVARAYGAGIAGLDGLALMVEVTRGNAACFYGTAFAGHSTAISGSPPSPRYLYSDRYLTSYAFGGGHVGPPPVVSVSLGEDRELVFAAHDSDLARLALSLLNMPPGKAGFMFHAYAESLAGAIARLHAPWSTTRYSLVRVVEARATAREAGVEYSFPYSPGAYIGLLYIAGTPESRVEGLWSYFVPLRLRASTIGREDGRAKLRVGVAHGHRLLVGGALLFVPGVIVPDAGWEPTLIVLPPRPVGGFPEQVDILHIVPATGNTRHVRVPGLPEGTRVQCTIQSPTNSPQGMPTLLTPLVRVGDGAWREAPTIIPNPLRTAEKLSELPPRSRVTDRWSSERGALAAYTLALAREGLDPCYGDVLAIRFSGPEVVVRGGECPDPGRARAMIARALGLEGAKSTSEIVEHLAPTLPEGWLRQL